MKIIVITGSPHKAGTSALLADRFIEGAEKAGNEIFRFDAAFEKVNPCLGCDYCSRNDKCVHDDSMQKLNDKLLAADVVALVTPLYYFGMSAQLKTVIDRFYANNSKLLGSGKKAVLLASAGDENVGVMNALAEHFKAITDYLEWEDAGILLAAGCGTRSDIEHSDFPKKAYIMGQRIGL